jgi:hypothetical protein
LPISASSPRFGRRKATRTSLEARSTSRTTSIAPWSHGARLP